MKNPSKCSTDESNSVKKRTTFFDLPGELRNVIYEHVLVDENPIEFAPIRLQHPNCEVEPDWYFLDHPMIYWSLERYKQHIRPSLTLLRASKQINQEASSIYYGQEFRFTNPTGWHILYHWLRLIGKKTRQSLRHITVCHPGMTKLLDMEMQDYWRGPGRTRYNLIETPVPVGFPEIADGLTFRKRMAALGSWARNSNPRHMLTSLSSLRTLRFVVFRWTGNIAFEKLQTHNIHSTAFPRAPNLQISVANLVANLYQKRHARCCNINEMELEAMYEQSPDDLLSRQRAVHSEAYREEGRTFYDKVKDQGWTVEEMYYDEEYRYEMRESDYLTDVQVAEAKAWMKKHGTL